MNLECSFIMMKFYELKTQGQAVQKAVGATGEYEADSFVRGYKEFGAFKQTWDKFKRHFG